MTNVAVSFNDMNPPTGKHRGHFFACIANQTRREFCNTQRNGRKSRAVFQILIREIGKDEFLNQLGAVRSGVEEVGQLLTDLIHSRDVQRDVLSVGGNPQWVNDSVRRWLRNDTPAVLSPSATPCHPESRELQKKLIEWLTAGRRPDRLALICSVEQLDPESDDENGTNTREPRRESDPLLFLRVHSKHPANHVVRAGTG